MDSKEWAMVINLDMVWMANKISRKNKEDSVDKKEITLNRAKDLKEEVVKCPITVTMIPKVILIKCKLYNYLKVSSWKN